MQYAKAIEVIVLNEWQKQFDESVHCSWNAIPNGLQS